MKPLFLSLFLLTTIAVKSQTLIADETTLSETKTTVKIETCNDSIFARLYASYEPIISRYSVAKKEIKKFNHKYREYSLYFPLDKKEELIRFVQSIKIEYK